MTENSTNDKTKSTTSTTPSKASSGEAKTATAAPEPETNLSDSFPGFIRKLGGLASALDDIDAARKEYRLPSLTPTDYRFVFKRPGGIPFSFPVQVIYKPGSEEEKDLGTYRIGR